MPNNSSDVFSFDGLVNESFGEINWANSSGNLNKSSVAVAIDVLHYLKKSGFSYKLQKMKSETFADIVKKFNAKGIEKYDCNNKTETKKLHGLLTSWITAIFFNFAVKEDFSNPEFKKIVASEEQRGYIEKMFAVTERSENTKRNDRRTKTLTKYSDKERVVLVSYAGLIKYQHELELPKTISSSNSFVPRVKNSKRKNRRSLTKPRKKQKTCSDKDIEVVTLKNLRNANVKVVRNLIEKTSQVKIPKRSLNSILEYFVSANYGPIAFLNDIDLESILKLFKESYMKTIRESDTVKEKILLAEIVFRAADQRRDKAIDSIRKFLSDENSSNDE